MTGPSARRSKSRSSPLTLATRLQERLLVPLDGSAEQGFADALAQTNRRRLLVFVPLMMAVHAVHAIVFSLGADPVVATHLPDQIALWRRGLIGTHLLTMVALAVAAALTLTARAPLRAWMAPVFSLVYIAHAVVIVGVDQLAITSVTPYLGYALAIAVVLVLTPAQAIVIFATGAVGFVVALVTMQDDELALQAALPNGVSVSLASATLSVILYLGRRRDFLQRATIVRQRSELEALNADLERRVQERVREVESLNAQLQARVRARSQELSSALKQLALKRGADGLLARGRVLGDRFEIETLIGEGGMGAVYAGVDRSTGERVAIKIIHAASARQVELMIRFLREAQATSFVSHRGAVRVLHVDVDKDGVLYQVQELVDGVTLEMKLRAGTPLLPAEAARLGAVLCDVLHAAHAQGVVHRDVKPDNVMLTRTEPGLKLLDFGIAKLFDAVVGDVEDVTGAGLAIGTPDYMAPEQLAGSADVTDRIDVFAVGLILYRATTLHLPFEGGSATVRMLRRTADDRPERAALEALGVPAFADAIEGALARDPARRPSARELGDALRAIADAAGAPPLEALAAGPRPARAPAADTGVTRI